jgi:hypothetical protein
MEQKDNNWDMATTLGRYLNSGGYGVGYIKDAINEGPAITPLLGLENPEKLTKFQRTNMVVFHIPMTDESLEYSWRAEDVLGQKGVLKIEREMEHNKFTNTKQVLFRWSGENNGSDWVDVDRVKDPQFVLDYIESCLNGKHSLPF